MMRTLTDAVQHRIAAIIAAHGAELARISGFIHAEPGFPVIDGQLLREPTIIVYVTSLNPEPVAPVTLGGVAVALVQPDPMTALALLPQPRDLAAAGATPIRYEPLPGNPIDQRIRIEMPLLCSVGPDVGWVGLKQFIAGTKHKLSVAMYDFSADYIARVLTDTATAQHLDIALTLDDGIDPSEQAIQDQLKQTLGAHYAAAIIHCGGGQRFPSAYHPKVVVQDDQRVWLSSGNWSPRSQPEIDPIGDPVTAKRMYSVGNREWHLVIDDAPLAKLFQRYILHDKADADPVARGIALAPPLPDLFVPVGDLPGSSDASLTRDVPPPPQAPAKLPVVPRHVMVQPLLSPDNYARRITEWIKGAKHSLHLQYAYITYSDKPQDADFRALLDWLGTQSWRSDFDLKIILGNSGTEKVRLLAQQGFNEKVLRVQNVIHNKGVVRDGESVLVSSQNWSGDGFLRNRDAGLIVEDAEIAAYFDAVFMADWQFRARDPFVAPLPPATIAAPGETPPPGTIRMTWREYFGD